LDIKPDAASIMFEFGLHCIGCNLSPYETIEQGAKSHGLSDKNIKDMLDKINKEE
jgi:hybrid cluster-associated redox disulfide protein